MSFDPYDREPDPCSQCGHPWHGLPCTRHTYDIERPICRCPGPWGSKNPI